MHICNYPHVMYMKQDDVDDDDDDDEGEDGMNILIPCMPDQKNGIQNENEAIRRGCGFGPSLCRTQRNEAGRNETRMNIKMGRRSKHVVLGCRGEPASTCCRIPCTSVAHSFHVPGTHHSLARKPSACECEQMKTDIRTRSNTTCMAI